MKEPTRDRSRLPAEPSYWDALASRVVGHATRGGDAPRQPWWRPIADLSPALVATAVLALLGGWALLDRPPPSTPAAPARVVHQALSPTEPGLRSLLEQSSPPTAERLLLLVPATRTPRSESP